MSLLVFFILMGLPAVGALLAWVAALRSWRTARSRIPPGSEVREARGRFIPFVILPWTLVLFGLVISFLLLGETVPDATAFPAVLAFGVPAFFAGLGMALVYRRGMTAAVGSKRGFGLVVPLAVMPETSVIIGLAVAFFLIGGSSGASGSPPFPTTTTWLASTLAMANGVGGLLSGWLATSAWDFNEAGTSPQRYTKVLSKASRGGTLSVVLFALALALFAEWFIVLLLVLYFGGVLAVGLGLFLRARRKREQALKPS